MGFTKQEKSWILYDWANSSYATIVLAAIFPIYFSSVCNANGYSGDLWWSIGTAVGTALAAILSPIVGAMADYRGMKKKLLVCFLLLGLFCTALCAVFEQWQWMLVGYALSYVGFSCSCMIYDSFLIDVTTNARMDMVSAWGYSMGYIGGSTIPFLACIALMTFGASFGIDSVMASKLSMVITSFWWAVFSIPLLCHCHQTHESPRPQGNWLAPTLRSIRGTLREMLSQKALFYFMIAYFFYIDGVNTVIKMSTAYGETLGLDTTGMILALLVTQLVAVPCAILFGRLSHSLGVFRLLFFAIGLYVVICVTGFIMGFGIEENMLTIAQATTLFWCLAFLVGTVQGGIQALSRSHFGKLVPPEKSSDYFGGVDIFGNFAASLGPTIYAGVRGVTGRSSFAILALIALFV